MQAIREEIFAIIKNNIWLLCELHVEKRAIDLKWVNHTKYNSNEVVEWYKTCFIVKENVACWHLF